VAARVATATAIPVSVAVEPFGPEPEPTRLEVLIGGRSYYPGQLTVRARSKLTVELKNDDGGVDHDFALRAPGATPGATCTGPCRVTTTVMVAQPGRYEFYCTVHPYITGTLVVEP
jgi:hypothetical protein